MAWRLKKIRSALKKDLQKNLEFVNKKINDVMSDDHDIREKMVVLVQLNEIEKKENIDAVQKIKIKWEMEGDENL